jgi:hypothetical protein
LIIGFLYSCTRIQLITTINYSAIADSHALQFTTALTKSFQSAVPSLGTAWQRLLSCRVQRPPSSLALLHCRLHSTVHCLTSDSIFDWLQSRYSVMAFNSGHSSSSGLTSLQADEYPTPASCPYCRFSTATQMLCRR